MKTVTSLQIAEVYKIQAPLEVMKINQIFGVNAVDFYSNLGLKGHTGVDLRARSPLPCYAVCEGFVTGSGFDSGGGGYVDLETRPFTVEGQLIKLVFRYYHLSKIKVKPGKWIKAGTVVALTGNTGRYTTAPHLHFAMRVYYGDGTGRWQYDGYNGYSGRLDPLPLITYDWRLPVDKFYGKDRNWLIEFAFRFANVPGGTLMTPFLKKRVEAGRYIHRRLMAEGRTPPMLTDRENNALIYGSWDLDTVLDPAMFQNWSQKTKSQLNL